MLSTLRLALKNTRLNFRKRLPVALFLVVAMALLFVGNSIFINTQDGLKETYEQSLTGNLSISAKSSDGFTLFGSELPLIGEFFKIPLIPRYTDLVKLVGEKTPDVQTLPVVIGGGKLSVGSYGGISFFFAANLSDYFRFFPHLKILKGAPPSPGVPGIFLNQKIYNRISSVLKRNLELGETFLITTAQENTFVLREVRLKGVFSYPVSDSLFDSVVLIDADTGRQLNGYYVSESGSGASKAQTDLLTDNVDDLFSSSQNIVIANKSGISLKAVGQELKTDRSAPEADPGTWNFLLLREAGAPKDIVETQKKLSQAVENAQIDVQVRDWRDSAGGNAKIVWFLQWLFNIGLVFISLVACIIVMNSLSLSVAERVREIGTLRALGAQKAKVASLIGHETVLLVTGAGILGVLLGAFVLWLIAHLGGVSLTNPLIASLFGTNLYLPKVSWLLMLEHFGVSLILGLISMGLPIHKTLKVAPIQAMARE